MSNVGQWAFKGPTLPGLPTNGETLICVLTHLGTTHPGDMIQDDNSPGADVERDDRSCGTLIYIYIYIYIYI